jgi:hypothetical protein
MKIYNITEDEQARLLDLATTLAAGNTEPSELEREAEVLLESMEKIREEIADGLRDLRGAFANLGTIWEHHPQVCARLAHRYPFKLDFDELVYNVNDWTGYNIEQYDPAPEPVIETPTPVTYTPAEPMPLPAERPAPPPIVLDHNADDDIPW